MILQNYFKYRILNANSEAIIRHTNFHKDTDIIWFLRVNLKITGKISNKMAESGKYEWKLIE